VTTLVQHRAVRAVNGHANPADSDERAACALLVDDLPLSVHDGEVGKHSIRVLLDGQRVVSCSAINEDLVVPGTQIVRDGIVSASPVDADKVVALFTINPHGIIPWSTILIDVVVSPAAFCSDIVITISAALVNPVVITTPISR
jgi:hypothetical protein